MSESPHLLTARQVADRIGVSAETVLRWTRRGELPALRLPGGAIRYREDELEAWLEERATPGRGVLATPRDAAQGLGYSVLATPEDEENHNARDSEGPGVSPRP